MRKGERTLRKKNGKNGQKNRSTVISHRTSQLLLYIMGGHNIVKIEDTFIIHDFTEKSIVLGSFSNRFFSPVRHSDFISILEK